MTTLTPAGKALGDEQVYPSGNTTLHTNPGLTKREWYIGKALEGLLSVYPGPAETIAADAELTADALLNLLAGEP